MARPMTAAEMRAAMKKWNVQYREFPNWSTRTRPGPFVDVRGVVIHHTGSDSQSDGYLKWLFTEGRASEGIPAPLANVSTDMDGDVWVGAIGRANHAGKGSSRTLGHVTAEDYSGYRTELAPGPDDTDGNAHFYGNEVRYDGGQQMTSKQYASAVRWAAAICDHYGWSALSVIGHREWTARKNDPGKCLMNQFRSDVAALLKAGPKPAVTDVTLPSTEDDMPLTTADLDAVQARAYKANSDYAVAFWVSPNGTGTAIRNLLAAMKVQLDRIEDDVDGAAATQALLEKLDANVEALRAEAQGPKA